MGPTANSKEAKFRAVAELAQVYPDRGTLQPLGIPLILITRLGIQRIQTAGASGRASAVPLMVAARATGLHKSTANGPTSSHWTGTARRPAGLCREEGTWREGRQVFGQGSPRLSLQPPSLSSVFLLFLSLLTQPQRSFSTRPGVTAATPLGKQVLGSCSPVSTAASHLWDSVSNGFPGCTLGWFHGGSAGPHLWSLLELPRSSPPFWHSGSSALLIFHTPHSP